MKYIKWIGLASVILLVVSCFTPWVVIESKNIVVSGIDTASTNYGKPAYFHFVMALFFIVCLFSQVNFAQKIKIDDEVTIRERLRAVDGVFIVKRQKPFHLLFNRVFAGN